MTHPFPGNVRELENAIQAAVALAPGDEISEQDLRLDQDSGESARSIAGLSLSEVERRHIDRVLHEVGGNRQEAARVLGIDRSTLYRKLQRFATNDANSDD
jgi:two-component system response regulator HydG